MATFEVKIYKITIEEHPNADAIELAVVGDYRSIVRKDQFQSGDLVAYIPESAIVPDWLIQFLGLEGKLAGKAKNRTKAIKLRGVLSQGIIVPLEYRENVMDIDTHEWSDRHILPNVHGIGSAGLSVSEGDIVTKYLGITKYEPVIPSCMNGEVFNAFGQTLKYDVENIKKHPNIFEDGEEVCITEKIHGCADFDTIIDTLEHGKMKIGDIVKNKIKCHVKSYDISTNEVQFNEIIGHSTQENTGDWYELEIEDGQTIKLTGNHLIWLPELSCYRSVEDLNGDEILLIVK